MTLLLIILIIVLLLGGGFGYRSYGPRGGLGIVGVILLVVLVLWALGALPLRGQEATPALEATPAAQPALPVVVETVTSAADAPAAPDATLVTMPDGAPAVAVAIPPTAEPEEVKAIAETSAETQRDVASGDVPIEQATRPLEETPDPGDGGLAGSIFWLLSFFFGAYFRPQVVGRIRRAWPASWPPITDKRERWLNAGLQLAFFTAAFYLLHGWLPSTPQTIQAWLVAAGVSVAGGSTMKRLPDAPLIPPATPPGRVRP